MRRAGDVVALVVDERRRAVQTSSGSTREVGPEGRQGRETPEARRAARLAALPPELLEAAGDLQELLGVDQDRAIGWVERLCAQGVRDRGTVRELATEVARAHCTPGLPPFGLLLRAWDHVQAVRARERRMAFALPAECPLSPEETRERAREVIEMLGAKERDE